MNNARKVVELQKNIMKATKRGDYINAMKLQRELNRIQIEVERTSLASVALEMSVDDHYDAICRMVRMFVFADMLYGAAVDFKEFLKKYRITDIPLATMAEETARKCRSMTREIDNFNDSGLSEQFGNLCDECSMMVMNKIYAYEARLKERIKKQHENNGKETESKVSDLQECKTDAVG